MNVNQITLAVDNGQTVNWSNGAYFVRKTMFGEYQIACTMTSYCIGLYYTDKTGQMVLNGKEEEFFISAPDSI